jgi:molecular chaperone DnaJ
MAAKRDYYEVLGVPRDAALTDVKRAYRRLAVQHHPDKNPGDRGAEERFKEAAEAYAVLSDGDKRARYDRFGHAAVGGAGASPFSGGFDPDVFGDFADVLGDLFGFGRAGGRRRGGRGATRGADLRYDLTLSFEEAAFGSEQTLRIPRLESCEECHGSGSAGNRPPQPCSVCGGRGQVAFSQGFLTVARTCPQCGGEGAVISDPCAACHGEGRVERERSLEVKIPAGVDHGARLRLGGEGEHGRRGGPPGDLFVLLRVEPHERFRREGAEVWGEEVVSYAQAVLGTTLTVDTLHGEATLEVPAGTPHGREFRLRGKGIDRLGAPGRGDHVVRVEVRVPHPRELSEEEVELLRRLAEIGEQPVKGRVLDKVKKMFG